MDSFEVAGRKIGGDSPCFVIAEAGVNHNGDLALAKMLIAAAADAGADAVKFQTFRSELLVSASAPKAQYQKETTDEAESQLEMLKKLELDEAAHRELIAECRARGIMFLSTPFEEDSADLLETLGVPAFKLPSGEITNLPFLAHVARKGRPLILSTGMSQLDEVRSAVQTIREAGNPPLALLHCVSAYPADPRDANLRAMKKLAGEFNMPVGFSDHTEGIEIPLAAVALGACIIEKHFTLDRNLPGPDHRASLEPLELAAMVRGIRRVQSALGDGEKRPRAAEADTASVARKSIVAARDLPAGTQIELAHLAVRRPGTGLPPSRIPGLVGRRTVAPLRAGDLVTENSFT